MKSFLFASATIIASLGSLVHAAVLPRSANSFNLRIVFEEDNGGRSYLQPTGPKDDFKLGVVSPMMFTAPKFSFDTSKNALSAHGVNYQDNTRFTLGAGFERKSYVDIQTPQVPVYFAQEGHHDTIIKHDFGFKGANLTIGGFEDWWVCDDTEDLAGGNIGRALHLGRAAYGGPEPREGCQKAWIIRE